MENTEFEQVVVIKIRDMCCTAYQKKLRKHLLKFDGVLSVSINPDKSLVSIKGKVEADLLLKTISKSGKYAEIVYYNKNPYNDEYTDAGEFKHGPNAQERHQNENNQQSGNGRGRESYGYKVEEEKEKHKCEDYIPPSFDERLCRDFYGRDPRMGPIFRDHRYYPYPVSQPNHTWHRYGPPRWFPPGPPDSPYGARPMPGFHNYGRGWRMM